MKPIITVILLTALLSFSSCSEDKTDKQPSTQAAPAYIETKPPAPNPANSQALQPDLHLSGTQNTHISGSKVTSNHLSGG
jgi:hypothetical protein